MDMPPEGTSGEAYLPKSAYSIARVAASKKTAGLEKGLANAHAQLKQALRDRDDAREQEQKDAALLDAEDGECDDVVESFELGLLGAVKKDRENPKYDRYFKHGLRDVTQAEPREEEPAKVGLMLTAMAQDTGDPEIGAVVTDAMPKLTASRDNVLKANTALTATEDALAFLETKTIPTLMASWRDEYKALEGALTKVYRTDTKRVDRCFKPFRKRPKAKVKDDDKKPPTGTTTPTTP